VLWAGGYFSYVNAEKWKTKKLEKEEMAAKSTPATNPDTDDENQKMILWYVICGL